MYSAELTCISLNYRSNREGLGRVKVLGGFGGSAEAVRGNRGGIRG